MHHIRAAQTAQYRAVRAITARGLAHPITLTLLAAAVAAAARAWDAGHSVTDTHPAPLREAPPRMPNHQGARRADDLHTRYMRASNTWRTHRKGCPPCRSEQHCPDGAPLYRQFTELQDDYLRRIRSQGGTRS